MDATRPDQTNDARRRFLLKTGGIAMAAGAVSVLGSGHAQAQTIRGLKVVTEHKYPSPTSFFQNMSSNQPDWVLRMAPEPIDLCFATNDNEHRFTVRKGRLISMGDPLFKGAGVQLPHLAKGVLAKATLRDTAGTAWIPPQAYLLYESRWELVKEQGVSNGQNGTFETQVRTGANESRTQTIIDAVATASWGKGMAQGSLTTTISTWNTSSFSESSKKFTRDMIAAKGERARYLLWSRVDRYRIVDGNLRPITFSGIWIIHEGPVASNQATAVIADQQTEIRTVADDVDRVVFPL